MREILAIMSPDQIGAALFVLLWILTGLGLAAAIVWRDGAPDRETWDGPEIDWGATFDLVGACVIGGPLWFVLFWHLKRTCP